MPEFTLSSPSLEVPLSDPAIEPEPVDIIGEDADWFALSQIPLLLGKVPSGQFVGNQ